MKRKHLLLMMLLAICAPWAAMGQVTLTVCDGTATNNCIPVYGLYVDTDGLTSEFIIPADSLSDMEEGTISSLQFYSKTSAAPWTNASFKVYLAEVAGTTLSAITGPDAATVVYEGSLTVASNSMTVNFTNNYTYSGGNLLIGTLVTTKGTYQSASFYGIESTSSAYYQYEGWNGTTGGVQNFLPKTTFTYTPGTPSSCVKPESLVASEVTGNSATLTWTGGSGTYNVDYKKASETDWTSLLSNTSLTTTNLTNLDPVTEYQARVQSVCEGDEVSTYRSTSFTTPCVAITIFPWDEDFEGFTASTVPNCWDNSASTSSTLTNNPHYIWGVYNYSSNNMLRMYNYYVNTGTALINTPEIELPSEGVYQLSFDYSHLASCGAFTVKVSEDGGETFTELGTYPSTSSSYSSTNPGTFTAAQPIVLSSYVGKTIIVQFFANANYGSGSIFLDNVSIDLAPSCLPPTNLAATDITANSAELSWMVNSDETAWTLYYKKSADTDYNSISVDDNAYTLSNLDANTSYDFYVVANCSATDQSLPSAVYSFTTECEVFSAYPYTENFDSYNVSSAYNPSTRTLPNCWSAINTTTHSSYAAYPSVYYYSSTNYANSTPNCLRLYSYYSSSSYTNYDPQPQYAILPEMSELAGKQITLWARGHYATSTFKIGTMTDPTDVSTFVEITEQELTTSYQEFIYNVPADATANYIAIMIDAADEDRYSNSVYIDDITIDLPPACPKPTELAVSDVTAHTAQLSWTSDADAWQICLNEDEENLITANANPFSLTGLAENTSYTAKVRAVCDGVPGDWSGTSVNFTTPLACPAPTGLAVSNITGHEAKLTWTGTSEGYDVMYRTSATAADGLFENFVSSPSDWTRYTGLMEYVLTDSIELSENSSYWTYNNYNGVFDKHARINIYGTNVRNWLVSPSIELPEGATFSFDLALTKYNGTLVPVVDSLQQDDKFVVLISNDDMNTWTILRQWDNAGSEYVFNNIACSATGEQVSLDVSAYVGQNVRIAFYGESTSSADNNGGDNNMHIDNILVGLPISAGEWQTLVSDTTAYTLTGLIPETDYEVKVVSSCEGEIGYETNAVSFTTDVTCPAPTKLTAEAGNYTAELSWTSIGATAWQIQVGEDEPIDVTENPYTLENLEPETEYTVKVRANCGDEGYSEWSEAVTFTTLVACPVPTDIEASNITYNSASLSWTGYSDSYNIQYNTAATLGDPIFSEDFSGDIDDWTMQDCAASTGLNNGAFRFSWNSNPPQYLISPEITGITEDAILEFTYYNHSSTWEETFQVGLSSTDNATDSFTWSETITASDRQQHTYHATVPAGTKYMAIKLLSNDKYYLSIDDIVIGSAILAGDPITVTSEEESATLTDLTPNTEYEVKVQGVCGETTTEWTEIVSFTTLSSFTKEIAAYTEDGGYYLIASPLAADVAPTAVTGMITDDLGADATPETSTYDLYSFNQAQELEWQNYRNSTFDLVNGTGYLYASKEGTTLTFSGTPYSGDGVVQLTHDADASFAGWNLIGNPFADTAYIEVPFYTMNEGGSEVMTESSTSAIEPMEGVFVIATGTDQTVTFSTTEPDKKGSMLALNLSQGRGTIDRAIVSFDEGQTLPKLQLRETSTKVYIPMDGTDYAVVRSEGTGEVPVNFKAEENGTYTMSFSNEAVEFSYLHLIDNMTGADVDLLENPSYSFEAKSTDYASRFKLVFATGSSLQGDDFAFVSNEHLMIYGIEGDAILKVMDLTGRTISTESFNGSYDKAMNLSNGVYMLQLIQGAEVRTQKIVL